MKKFLPIVLVVLVFLPIITIFAFDARYVALQNNLCARFHNEYYLQYDCRDGVRLERERIVTTTFYRHIADYFGREEGTSVSALDSFVLASDDAMASYDARAAVKKELGAFNREFVAWMFVSVVIASVSGTLLVQKLIAHRRAKK